MAEALPEYPDSDFSDEENQSPLDVSFNKAAAHVRSLTARLEANQLLELYALFKQGTQGKCNAPKPGWFDAKGRKKWEAWRNLEEMPSEQAKEKYVQLVQYHDPEFSCSNREKSAGPKDTWVTVSSLRYSPEPDLIHQELSLLDAAREDCSDRVRELLAESPDLRQLKDEDGLTALHWAADRNSVNSLLAALQGGCDVDAVDACGQTALHYAASCGHAEATKLLVEAGASLLKDEDDCTPLDLATDDEVKMILRGAKQ